MERKLVREYVDQCFYIDDSIEEVIQNLKDLQNKGCTHVYTRAFEDHINFYFYYYREENDSELQYRLETLKRNEEHDRKIYERLKLRFENNK
jgi:hypothetical protein